MLQQQTYPFTTFLSSLGIEGLEVIKPLPVTLRPDGAEFIASFFDANISTAGETPQEAIDNLQTLLADFFELLDAEPEANLGSKMKKQRRVLQEFVCQTSRGRRRNRSPKSSTHK